MRPSTLSAKGPDGSSSHGGSTEPPSVTTKRGQDRIKIASHKYNPGFHDDDELIVSFVVRQYELAHIVDALRDDTGEPCQHVLIVGPRGGGKTMLVRRAVAAAPTIRVFRHRMRTAPGS